MGVVLIPLATVIALMPFWGLLLLGCSALSGVITGLATLHLVRGTVVPLAAHVLGLCCKAYLAGLLLVFPVMVTFSFQHCCIGVQRFTDHLRHFGSQSVGLVRIAVLWPYALFFFSRNMAGWGMTWLDIVANAVECWFITSRKGVTMEAIDLQTGESVTTQVLTPEEARATLVREISKLGKE